MTLTRQSIHRLVLRQRRLAALLAVACLLLSLVVPTSCVEPLTPEQKLDYLSKDLTLRFYLPGNGIATKAVPGDVESINPESRIYNVQVWAFNHADPSATGEALAAIDAETAVAYTEAYNIAWNNTSQLPNGSNYYAETYWDGAYTLEVPMRIPGYILDRPAADMKFDFYVLANASSVSRTVAINATRKQIKEASFGYTSATSDPFGPNGPKYGATPIAAINGGASTGPGLPISGFFNKDKTGAATGVDLSFLQGSNYASMTPAQVHEQLPIVQLERAVSKLRFVFAKQGNTAGVQITKIEVNSGMIPYQTFLFPREDGTEFVLPEGSRYMTAVTTISGIANSDILAVDNPELLRSDCTTNGNATKTAQEYEAFLNEAVGSTTATQRYVYLRESGLPLSCTIYYKLSDGGAEQQATFSMSQITGYDATTTNFHRNHYWTVYAYFKGGGLYIKPVVLPWYVGGDYDFTTPGTAYVTSSDKVESLFGYGWTTSTENSWYTAGKPVEWFFRRVDASNPTADDWKDWVHSQIVVAPGANIANTPIYANRIELHTNGFTEPLRLKLTNTTDFYLVIYHANTTGNAYEVIDAAGGAEIPVDIAAGGISYFYVAPKEGADHEGKTTGAYLVTADTDQKIPFNPGAFPGSNENTEIYFYSVSQGAFEGYYTSRPANIKAYGKKIEDGKEVIGEISL